MDDAAAQQLMRLIIMSDVRLKIGATLEALKPEGRTAMRDAFLLCLKPSLVSSVVGKAAEQADIPNRTTMIVITDGADNSSQLKQSQLEGMLRTAHEQMKAIDLNITLCFVGSDAGAGDLRRLARAAPDVCKFVNANRVSELEGFFSRMALQVKRSRGLALGLDESSGKATLGVVERQSIGLRKVVQRVVFCLDMSGSMAGGRWTALKAGVKKVMQQLEPGDAVMAVLFNHEVKGLTENFETIEGGGGGGGGGGGEQHCRHCRGGAAGCGCEHGCRRPDGSRCWTKHCSHCKGGPAPCGCSSGCRKPNGTKCTSATAAKRASAATSSGKGRLTDGDFVKLAPGVAGGCLKQGKVGKIVVDDRSHLPYKVQAEDGKTFWYKPEQLVKAGETCGSDACVIS